MNIPNIPSDNLYKYIALSSLTVLIISTIYFYNKEMDIEKDTYLMNNELKEIETNTKLLQLEQDFLVSSFNNVLTQLYGEEQLVLLDSSWSDTGRISHLLLELNKKLSDEKKYEAKTELKKTKKDLLSIRMNAEKLLLATKILENRTKEIAVKELEKDRLKMGYFLILPVLLIAIFVGFYL
ncbi:MAG: hypothetical protein OEM46_08415 [Ignavibacteria bacterium]|nr:hypothetical protein [Ignavibacteria bacterium]